MANGTNSEARKRALETAVARKPLRYDPPRGVDGKISVVAEFGTRAFDLPTMRECLAKPIYERIRGCIERTEPLDQSIAAIVAHAAKEWAMGHGATHFCHWFQPLTGSTAEKHDAFLTRDPGESPIERLAGSQLLQSEPDASSFPHGGTRATFEARGYTAWDPASPMFLMTTELGVTLCIPSAYMSYHGGALDEKTGLLRSIQALSTASMEVLRLFGQEDIQRVTSMVGPEQEYFLIDRAFTAHRPDLLLGGRTVLGAPPAKGQQLSDHYFGAIPPRVNAVMSEFEHELYLLGVPVKTRHNEVAPAQYESAPIFEEANVAADHNQLTMEVIRRVARKHDFHALFHEKPFAGINGSGKHLNWSAAARLTDGSWDNLFSPGDTPAENIRFLLMTAAVLRAIHRSSSVMRAAIASSGNDHRLGANEAPPAIISVFLGETLSKIFDQLAEGVALSDPELEREISLGIAHLPSVARDNTDRNRTSPFAFTGNKWEFRACGSSVAISFPITVLNAAMAESLKSIAGTLTERMEAGAEREAAVQEVLQSIARETQAIRFEGDNYSDDWVAEAEARGLPNLRKTPDALAALAEPANYQFLVDAGVFSDEELNARVQVRLERYLMDIDIECSSLCQLVDTAVAPAASQYLGDLATSVSACRGAGVDSPAHAGRLELVAASVAALEEGRAHLERVRTDIDGAGASESAVAHRYAYELCPAMEAVRAAADHIEVTCDDGLWSLPRYHEMLFVR